MQHAVDRAIALGGNPAFEAEWSRIAAMRRARALTRAGDARRGVAAPRVAHVSALGGDDPAREVIGLVLDAIARELEPLALTFFRVGPDGEIASSVVHASHLPPAELAEQVRTWKTTLRACDPLAPRRLPAPPPRIAALRGDDASAAALDPRVRDVYRHLGVANDARLLIRDGERVVAGVTLWRCWRSRPWSSAELRRLRALQPLVEMAYLSRLAESAADGDGLPETLTGRERQVARVLARGATNEELARALHVSPNTAKTHTRAVMAKLGMTSRRELIRRFAPMPAATPDLLRSARREPGDPLLWVEGTTTEQQLMLVPVLGWAAERVGAAVGGLATVGARGSLDGDACGTARPSAHGLDRRLVHELRREIVSGPLLARVAVDAAAPAVAPLDAYSSAEERRRLNVLLTRLGLATPLVSVLRPFGRVAALAWVAQDERTAAGVDGVRELRSGHPLLEVAYAAPLAGSRTHPSAVADLAGLRLSPRQMEVARLALEGAGNDEIARRLSLAPSTVKNHMTRILTRSGLQSRTQLIAAFGVTGGDREGGD